MEFLDEFAQGALKTIELTVYSGLIGFGIALIAGTAMLSRFRLVRFVARTYTEIFRGASEVVILYVFVFGLPQWTQVDVPAFAAAVVALALNIGGYMAEVVRGAVQAVPQGQTEAAVALNMSSFLRLRRIIVPQAIVAMLPPINVLTVQLLKASALVSIVMSIDLTAASKGAVRITGNDTLYYGMALIAYYIIATAINQIFHITEWSLRRGRDIGGPGQNTGGIARAGRALAKWGAS